MADGSTHAATLPAPTFSEMFHSYLQGEESLRCAIEQRMQYDVTKALHDFNELNLSQPAVVLSSFELVNSGHARIHFVGHYNAHIQDAYDFILRSVPWWVPTRIRRAA